MINNLETSNDSRVTFKTVDYNSLYLHTKNNIFIKFLKYL